MVRLIVKLMESTTFSTSGDDEVGDCYYGLGIVLEVARLVLVPMVMVLWWCG